MNVSPLLIKDTSELSRLNRIHSKNLDLIELRQRHKQLMEVLLVQIYFPFFDRLIEM